MDTIADCKVALGNKNLAVPKKPDIYVPPQFHYVESGAIESDVIFVQAPAAVGKSITANYIASTKGAPMLDLSRVPVGTDSLRGMIGNDAALDAFRIGTLPIIVDSIDEGRIVSGEQSFEQFLFSTGALLAGTPNHERPKIVFFGRPESAAFAELAIRLESDVSLCKIELDYFDKIGALTLINKSAETVIDDNPRLDDNQKNRLKKNLNNAPMNALKDTYFNAIAQALGLSGHDLWTDNVGRSFAGYAPVLSTLAIMLAGSDNPHRDSQALEVKGEAWDVVSSVLRLVMDREQDKFRQLLNADIQDLPDIAYSSDEQLSYLSQIIRCVPIEFSGKFKFGTNRDKQRYMKQVTTFLPEHPFVRDGMAANDVLGAAIGAHVILTGLEEPSAEGGHNFGTLSRKPFLWRHLRERLLQETTVIDGCAIGFLLNSYFSDPVSSVGQVVMRDSDEGGIVAIIGHDDDIRVDVIPPAVMFQAMRNMDIDISAKIVIGGPGFAFSGTNSIMCEDLEFRPGNVWIHGELSIVPSGSLSFGEPIRFHKDGEAHTTLSRKFYRSQWPNQDVDEWESDAPDGFGADEDVLEFIRYLSTQQNRAVVVSAEYSLSKKEDDSRWKRVYNLALPYSRRFLKVMVDLGYAETSPIGTAAGLSRITFKDVDWDFLLGAFSGQDNVYSALCRAVYRHKAEGT